MAFQGGPKKPWMNTWKSLLRLSPCPLPFSPSVLLSCPSLVILGNGRSLKSLWWALPQPQCSFLKSWSPLMGRNRGGEKKRKCHPSELWAKWALTCSGALENMTHFHFTAKEWIQEGGEAPGRLAAPNTESYRVPDRKMWRWTRCCLRAPTTVSIVEPVWCPSPPVSHLWAPLPWGQICMTVIQSHGPTSSTGSL